MDIYLELFLTTAITGVGALALGGALAAAVHAPSDRAVSLLLRFTAGVMLSVVCFDLLADAMEGGGLVKVILWVLAGYFATHLLNSWIDRRAHHSHSHGHGHDHDHDGHDDHDDHDGHDDGHHSHHHEHGPDLSQVHVGRDNGEMCVCGRHTLHTAGLVLAAAVALHNMPVGMAIGATFAGDASGAGHGGVLAALIIGLHNLPEGMSIAAPLLTGGSRPAGAIAVAAASGVPTILGALLGYSVGTMSPAVLAASLSFAAGAMLYVVLGELLPEAEDLWRHRLSGLATLLGLLLGLALIAGGHVH